MDLATLTADQLGVMTADVLGTLLLLDLVGADPGPLGKQFKVIGKLLAFRNLSVTHETLYEQFVVSTEAQASKNDQFAAFNAVWFPFSSTMGNYINSFGINLDVADRVVQKVIQLQIAPILGFSINDSIQDVITALIAYMTLNGITVENTSDGYEAYFAGRFVDSDGNPCQLPASSSPSIPDSWIDINVIGG